MLCVAYSCCLASVLSNLGFPFTDYALCSARCLRLFRVPCSLREMGKKQHQSDRPFLSNKEWKELGGYKQIGTDPTEQRLPFDHCALTFTPWTTPVCDRDGNIFDLMSATQHTTAPTASRGGEQRVD